MSDTQIKLVEQVLVIILITVGLVFMPFSIILTTIGLVLMYYWGLFSQGIRITLTILPILFVIAVLTFLTSNPTHSAGINPLQDASVESN